MKLLTHGDVNPGNVNLMNPNELKNYLQKPAVNSRVILLGKATHGTKEFNEIKSDIVKILGDSLTARHSRKTYAEQKIKIFFFIS